MAEESSITKEEMDVSENGDGDKTQDSEQSDSKSPSKKEKKEEDGEEEEDDDDDDDEEPPLGLLERPVVLASGKREKKKVERLSMSMKIPDTRPKNVEIQEGSGTKLGDCPRIEHKMNHIKAADLKTLHRILYLKPGKASVVKKNIRQFSGFPFGKQDKEFEKRITNLNKLTTAGLKQICEVLDIERGGVKTAIVERIMDFLLKPSSSGLPVQQKKKKRKSKGDKEGKGKTGTKRKRSPNKKKTEKKTKANKDTVSDISDSDDDDDDEEEEEEEKEKKDKAEKEEAKSESEEEEEEDEPPKKKAKTEKKAPAKKEAPKAKKQNGKQEKAKAEKKESKKSISDSDDSDSDDEPLAAKKSEPPANSELKDVIKKILEGADLEEVTMKTVVKQVYEKYPSFDLTDRKDFIKSTVREIIS